MILTPSEDPGHGWKLLNTTGHVVRKWFPSKAAAREWASHNGHEVPPEEPELEPA